MSNFEWKLVNYIIGNFKANKDKGMPVTRYNISPYPGSILQNKHKVREGKTNVPIVNKIWTTFTGLFVNSVLQGLC